MQIKPKYIKTEGQEAGLPLVTDGVRGVTFGVKYLSITGGNITGNLEITGTLTINGVEVTPGAQPYTYDTDYKCLIFS